jgi:ElaB/YqjD/DUF883 family membrane-anchored ribosome-binding protein
MADNNHDDTLLRATPSEAPITETDHLLAEHASRGQAGQVAATDDPDATRAEIERTRDRMSRTLDSIESALIRKKEQIQEKLDVMAPVRERPLVSVGAVFGGALVLGYLTGGGRDDEDEPRARTRSLGATGMPLPLVAALDDDDADVRAELWEKRARRLLRVARSQEEELSSLRARDEDGDDEGGALRALGANAAEVRDGLVAGLAAFITEAFHKLRDGAEDVAEAAADRYGDLRDRAGDGVEALALGDRIDHLKEAASHGLDAVKERTSDGLEAVRDRVDSIRG